MCADSNIDYHLRPFQELLSDPDTTEVVVNGPDQVFCMVSGQFQQVDLDTSDEMIKMLARVVGAREGIDLNEDYPFLSASLPNGHRIQFVHNSVSPRGYAMAIRTHRLKYWNLQELEALGAFNRPVDVELKDTKNILEEAQQQGWPAFLKAAIKLKQNILISGQTDAGKTTLLNAIAHEIPADERIITIEDVREVNIQHKNQLNLVTLRKDMTNALLAALRLNPNRILVSEVRGAEALPMLRAIQSGHAGSMTTIHADTPEKAVNQLVLACKSHQDAKNYDPSHIENMIKNAFDVIVQMSRTSQRFVSDVVWWR